MQDHIYVKGARENNLKNVDVTIPRDKLVVLTGLSGSGKSSLAFDSVLLRPDVPGTDGEARRGLHRRPVPRHLH